MKNDAALIALLGSANKVRSGTVGQGVKKPYVVVDVEDSIPTNTFDAGSDLDFTSITIFSVSDRAYSNSNGVGVDEISKAVRTALDYVSAGTYNGETIARCTFQRSGSMQEDRIANNVQVTKEDEYLVSINRAVVGLPTVLTATLYGYNVIDLSWTDGTGGGSDLYEIWRAENGGSFTFLDTTTNADSYRDLISGDNSRYFSYKVRALTGDNYSLFSNESGAVTTEIRAQGLWDARDLSANIIASGVDDRSVAILDQSASLAETLIKEFDFSSGVDGTTSVRSTITGGNNNISDGTTSKDNCLKQVMTSGNANHQIRYSATIGLTYSTGFWFFIPTDNAKVDGINISFDSEVTFINYSITGVWTFAEFKGVANISNVRIYAADGGISSNLDANGDVIYIASGWEINEIQGSHFTQVASASRGLNDSALLPTQISFNGVNEFSEITVAEQVAKFSNLATLSIFWINDSDNVTSGRMLSLGDSATNNTNVFVCGYSESLSGAFISFRVDGVVTTLYSDSDLSIDDSIEWKQDGVSWRCFINEIEDTVLVSSGANNSICFNSINGVDEISIAKRVGTGSGLYQLTEFKNVTIISPPPSDAASASYSRGLKVKHNLPW